MLQTVMIIAGVLLLSFSIVDAYLQVLDQFSNCVDSFYDQQLTHYMARVEGYIEPSDPPDACHDIIAPSFPVNLTRNKIVLINDSNCDLITKICFAKTVGYDTVVIFHSADSLNFGQLIKDLKLKIGSNDFTDCTLNMAVFFIYSDDAAVIIHQYAYDPSSKQNYLIKITPDAGSWVIQTFLSLAVWMIPVLLLSFCFTGIRRLKERYYTWKWRKYMEGKSAIGRLKTLFPPVNFTEDIPYDRCIICLCHFTVGEKLRVLACLHAYHPECIDAWLLRHRRRCPVCNRKVILGDSFDDMDPDPSESTPLLTPILRNAMSHFSPESIVPTSEDNSLTQSSDQANLAQSSQSPNEPSRELMSPTSHAIQLDNETIAHDHPPGNRPEYIV